MDRDEAVSILKGRLTRFTSSSGDALETYIVTELKAAQRRFERAPVLPWFLHSEIATASEDIDDDRIQVPSNFIRELDEFGMWFVDSDGNQHPMRKMDYEDMVQRYDATDSDERVKAYALMGNYFYCRPVPSTGSTYSIRTLFYKNDDLLSTGSTENQWLSHAPDLLIAGAGEYVAGHYLRDRELKADFAAERQIEWDSLWRETEARKQANAEMWMED